MRKAPDDAPKSPDGKSSHVPSLYRTYTSREEKQPEALSQFQLVRAN